MSEEQIYNTTLSEQIESALEHYEDLATKGHHWNSLVVAAIKSYNPSKDQQIKYLESLLEHASIVIELKTDNNTFQKLKEEYQQNYPNQ